MLAKEKKVLEVDANKIRRLFLKKDFGKISKMFLDGLMHMQTYGYISMSPDMQNVIDNFVEQLLHVFSQPDFVAPNEHAETYLALNGTISNMVYMSSFKNTDPWINIISNQKDNMFRMLTLYSARNELVLDRAKIFSANSTLASVWWCNFFILYHTAICNKKALEHLREHMKHAARLTEVRNFHSVSFGSTYIDPEQDREVKLVVNNIIKEKIASDPPPVVNKPNKKSIGVVSGCWFDNHSVWRNQKHFLEALSKKYDLTLFEIGDGSRKFDTSMFKKSYRMKSEGPNLSIADIVENDFCLLYYPDVGMHLETIFLSNMRLAPIQVTSYGHSVSTFGSNIDYFIGSDDVEVPEAQDFYSEKLVRIKGLGVTNVPPKYVPSKTRKVVGDRVIVNCNWYSQKVNHELLSVLSNIHHFSGRRAIFRIFSGAGPLDSFGFPAFVKDIMSFLGDCVQIMPPMNYMDYMAALEEGDFALEPYPFGGCNTVVDHLWIKQPIITWRGKFWRNRVGSAILERVGLGHLVADTNADFVRKAVDLIDNPIALRKERDKVSFVELERALLAENKVASKAFVDSIDTLIDNHYKANIPVRNGRKEKKAVAV